MSYRRPVCGTAFWLSTLGNVNNYISNAGTAVNKDRETFRIDHQINWELNGITRLTSGTPLAFFTSVTMLTAWAEDRAPTPTAQPPR